MNTDISKILTTNDKEILDRIERYKRLDYSPLAARLRIGAILSNPGSSLKDIDEDIELQDKKGTFYFNSPIKDIEDRLWARVEAFKQSGALIRPDIDPETGEYKAFIDFDEIGDINPNTKSQLIDLGKNLIIGEEFYTKNKNKSIDIEALKENISDKDAAEYLMKNYSNYKSIINNIVLDSFQKQAEKRYIRKAVINSWHPLVAFSTNATIKFTDSFLDSFFNLKGQLQRIIPEWDPEESDFAKLNATLFGLEYIDENAKEKTEKIRQQYELNKVFSSGLKGYLVNDLAEGLGGSFGFFTGSYYSIAAGLGSLKAISSLTGIKSLAAYPNLVTKLRNIVGARSSFGQLYSIARADKGRIASFLGAMGKHSKTYLMRLGTSGIETLALVPRGLQNYFDQLDTERDFIYDVFLDYQLETISEMMLLEGNIANKKLIAPVGNMIYNAMVNVLTEEVTNLAQDIAKGTDTSIFTPSKEDKPFIEKYKAQIDAAAISSTMILLSGIGGMLSYGGLLIKNPKERLEFFTDLLQSTKYRELAKILEANKFNFGEKENSYGVQVFQTMNSLSEMENEKILEKTEQKVSIEEFNNRVNSKLEELKNKHNLEEGTLKYKVAEGMSKFFAVNNIDEKTQSEFEQFLLNDIDYKRLDKKINEISASEKFIENGSLKITGDKEVDKKLENIFLLNFVMHDFSLTEENKEAFKLDDVTLNSLSEDENKRKEINQKYNEFIESSVGQEVSINKLTSATNKKLKTLAINSEVNRIIKNGISESLKRLSRKEIIEKGKQVIENIKQELKEKEVLLPKDKQNEVETLKKKLSKSIVWKHYDSIIDFILAIEEMKNNGVNVDYNLELLEREAIKLLDKNESYNHNFGKTIENIQDSMFSNKLSKFKVRLNEEIEKTNNIEELEKNIIDLFNQNYTSIKDALKVDLKIFTISLLKDPKSVDEKKLNEKLNKIIDDIISKYLRPENFVSETKVSKGIMEFKSEFIQELNKDKELVELFGGNLKYANKEVFDNYIKDKIDFRFHQFKKIKSAEISIKNNIENKKNKKSSVPGVLGELTGKETQKGKTEQISTTTSIPKVEEKQELDAELQSFREELQSLRNDLNKIEQVITTDKLPLLEKYIKFFSDKVKKDKKYEKLYQLFLNDVFFGFEGLIANGINDIETIKYILDKLSIVYTNPDDIEEINKRFREFVDEVFSELEELEKLTDFNKILKGLSSIFIVYNGLKAFVSPELIDKIDIKSIKNTFSLKFKNTAVDISIREGEVFVKFIKGNEKIEFHINALKTLLIDINEKRSNGEETVYISNEEQDDIVELLLKQVPKYEGNGQATEFINNLINGSEKVLSLLPVNPNDIFIQTLNPEYSFPSELSSALAVASKFIAGIEEKIEKEKKENIEKFQARKNKIRELKEKLYSIKEPTFEEKIQIIKEVIQVLKDIYPESVKKYSYTPYDLSTELSVIYFGFIPLSIVDNENNKSISNNDLKKVYGIKETKKKAEPVSLKEENKTKKEEVSEITTEKQTQEIEQSKEEETKSIGVQTEEAKGEEKEEKNIVIKQSTTEAKEVIDAVKIFQDVEKEQKLSDIDIPDVNYDEKPPNEEFNMPRLNVENTIIKEVENQEKMKKELLDDLTELLNIKLNGLSFKNSKLYNKIKQKLVEDLKLNIEDIDDNLVKSYLNFLMTLRLGDEKISKYFDYTGLLTEEERKVYSSIINRKDEFIKEFEKILKDNKDLSVTKLIEETLNKIGISNVNDRVKFVLRLFLLDEKFRIPTHYVFPFAFNKMLNDFETRVNPGRLKEALLTLNIKGKDISVRNISTFIRLYIGVIDEIEEGLRYLIGFDTEFHLSSHQLNYLRLEPDDIRELFRALLYKYYEHAKDKEAVQEYLDILETTVLYLWEIKGSNEKANKKIDLIAEQILNFLEEIKGAREKPKEEPDKKPNEVEQEVLETFNSFSEFTSKLNTGIEFSNEIEGTAKYNREKNLIIVNSENILRDSHNNPAIRKILIYKIITHELSHSMLAKLFPEENLKPYYSYYNSLAKILIELYNTLKIEDKATKEEELKKIISKYSNQKLSLEKFVNFILKNESIFTSLLQPLEVPFKENNNELLLHEITSYIVASIDDKFSVLLYLLKPIDIDIDEKKERITKARYTDNLLNQYRLIFINQIVTAVNQFRKGIKEKTEEEKLAAENILSQINRIVSYMTINLSVKVIEAAKMTGTYDDDKEIPTTPPVNVNSNLNDDYEKTKANVIERALFLAKSNWFEYEFPALYSEVFTSGREVNLNWYQLREVAKQLKEYFGDEFKNEKDILTLEKKVEHFIELFRDSEEFKSHLWATEFYDETTGKDLIELVFYKIVELTQKLNSISHYPMVDIIFSGDRIKLISKRANSRNIKGTRITNYNNTILLKEWEKRLNELIAEFLFKELDITDKDILDGAIFLIGQVNDIAKEVINYDEEALEADAYEIEEKGKKATYAEAYSEDLRGKMRKIINAFAISNKIFLGFFADKNTIPYVDFGKGYTGRKKYLAASLLGIHLYRKYKEILYGKETEEQKFDDIYSDQVLDRLERVVKDLMEYNFHEFTDIIKKFFDSIQDDQIVNAEVVEEFIKNKGEKYKLFGEYVATKFAATGSIKGQSLKLTINSKDFNKFLRWRKDINIQDLNRLALLNSIAYRTFFEDLKKGLNIKSIKEIDKTKTRLSLKENYINIVKRHILASQIYKTKVSKALIDLINREFLDSEEWNRIAKKEKILKYLDEYTKIIAENLGISNEANIKELRELVYKSYLQSLSYRKKQFKLTDNNGDFVYYTYDKKTDTYDIKFKYAFMDSSELENFVGISRIDGAVFILPEAAHVLLTAQGGAYYGGIKNFVHIQEKGIYSKHAMFIVPDNDPLAKAMRKKKIAILFTDKSEKNKAQVVYHKRSQILDEGKHIPTEVMSIKDIHRIKEGSSENEEIRGLSQLINTTQLLLDKNTAFTDEDKKILQDFFSKATEYILERNFIDSDLENASKFLKKLMALMKAPSNYRMEISKVVTKFALVKNGIKDIQELRELEYDNPKEFIKKINKIIDTLSEFKAVIPISSTFGFYVREPLTNTVKLTLPGFSGVLYPDIFDDIRYSTVTNQFINELDLIFEGKESKYKQMLLDKNIIKLNEENKYEIVDEELNKLYNKYKKEYKAVYNTINKFKNTVNTIVFKAKYNDFNYRLVNTIQSLNSLLLKNYKDIFDAINQEHFDKQGKIKDDGIIISIEQASKLGLKVGDKLLSFIMPTDSPMSSIGVTVKGIMPEGIMPLGTMSLNSEYAQGLGGRDFDIDVMYIINKPKNVNIDEWNKVVDIFNKIHKNYVETMFNLIYDYLEANSETSIINQNGEAVITSDEENNIDELLKRTILKVDKLIELKNKPTLENIISILKNIDPEDEKAQEVLEILERLKKILPPEKLNLIEEVPEGELPDIRTDKDKRAYDRLTTILAFNSIYRDMLEMEPTEENEQKVMAELEKLGIDMYYWKVEGKTPEEESYDAYNIKIHGNSLDKNFTVKANKGENVNLISLVKKLPISGVNSYLLNAIQNILHKDSDVLREEYKNRLIEMKKKLYKEVKRVLEEFKNVREAKEETNNLENYLKKMNFVSSKEIRLMFMQLYMGMNPEFSKEYKVLSNSTLDVYEMFHKEIGLIILVRELFSLHSVIGELKNVPEDEWMLKHIALLILTNDFVDFPTNDNKTYYLSGVGYVFNKIFDIYSKGVHPTSKVNFRTYLKTDLAQAYNIPRMRKPLSKDGTTKSFFESSEMYNVIQLLDKASKILETHPNKEELMRQIPLFKLVDELTKGEIGERKIDILFKHLGKLFLVSGDVAYSEKEMAKLIFSAETNAILDIFEYDEIAELGLLNKLYRSMFNFTVELINAYQNNYVNSDNEEYRGLPGREYVSSAAHKQVITALVNTVYKGEKLEEYVESNVRLQSRLYNIFQLVDTLYKNILDKFNIKYGAQWIKNISSMSIEELTKLKSEIAKGVALKTFQIINRIAQANHIVNRIKEEYKKTGRKLNTKEVEEIFKEADVVNIIVHAFNSLPYIIFKPTGKVSSELNSLGIRLLGKVAKEFMINTLDFLAQDSERNDGENSKIIEDIKEKAYVSKNRYVSYQGRLNYLIYEFNKRYKNQEEIVDALIYDISTNNLMYITNVNVKVLINLQNSKINPKDFIFSQDEDANLESEISIERWRDNKEIVNLVENEGNYSSKNTLSSVFTFSPTTIENLSDLERLGLIENITKSIVEDILEGRFNDIIKDTLNLETEYEFSKLELIQYLVWGYLSLGGYAGEVRGSDVGGTFGKNIYASGVIDNTRFLGLITLLQNTLDTKIEKYISNNPQDESEFIGSKAELLDRYLESFSDNLNQKTPNEEFNMPDLKITSEEKNLSEVDDTYEGQIRSVRSFRKNLLDALEFKEESIEEIIEKSRKDMLTALDTSYSYLITYAEKNKKEKSGDEGVVITDDLINVRSAREYIDNLYEKLLETLSSNDTIKAKRIIYRIISIYNGINDIIKKSGQISLKAKLLTHLPKFIIDSQFNLTLFSRVFSNKIFLVGQDLPEMLSKTFRYTGNNDNNFSTDTRDIATMFSVTHSGEEFKGTNLSIIDVFFYKLTELNNSISYYKETTSLALSQALYPLQNTTADEYKRKTDIIYSLLEDINLLPYLLPIAKLNNNGVFVYKLFIYNSKYNDGRPLDLDPSNNSLKLYDQLNLFLNVLEILAKAKMVLEGTEIKLDEVSKKELKQLLPDLFGATQEAESENTKLITSLVRKMVQIKNGNGLLELIDRIRKQLDSLGNERDVILQSVFLLKYINIETGKLLSQLNSFLKEKIQHSLEKGEINETVDKLMQIRNKYTGVLFNKFLNNTTPYGEKAYYTYIPRLFTKEALINAVSTGRVLNIKRKLKITDPEELNGYLEEIVKNLREKLKDEMFISDVFYKLSYFVEGSDIKNLQQAYISMINDISSAIKKDLIGIYLDEYKKISYFFEDNYTRERFIKFLRREAGYSIFRKSRVSPHSVAEGTYISFYRNEKVSRAMTDDDLEFLKSKGVPVELINNLPTYEAPILYGGKLKSVDDEILVIETQDGTKEFKLSDIYSIEDDGTKILGEVATLEIVEGTGSNIKFIRDILSSKWGRRTSRILSLLLDFYVTSIRGFLNLMKSRFNQVFGTPLKMMETRLSYAAEFSSQYYHTSSINIRAMKEISSTQELDKFYERLRTLSQISDNLLIDIYYGESKKIDPDKIFDYMYSDQPWYKTFSKWKDEVKILRNSLKLFKITRNESYRRIVNRLSEIDEMIVRAKINKESEEEIKELMDIRQNLVRRLTINEQNLIAEMEKFNNTIERLEAKGVITEKEESIGDVVRDIENAISALKEKYKGEVIYFLGLTPTQAENILYKYLRDVFVNNRLKYINKVEGKIREVTFRLRFGVYYFNSNKMTIDGSRDFDTAIKYAVRGVVLDHALYDSLNKPLSNQNALGKAIDLLRQFTYNRFVNTILLLKETKNMLKVFGLKELFSELFRSDNKKLLAENPLQLLKNQLMVNSMLYTFSYMIPVLRWYMNPLYLLLATLTELGVKISDDDDWDKLSQKEKKFMIISLIAPFTGLLGSQFVLLSTLDKKNLIEDIIETYVFVGSFSTASRITDMIDTLGNKRKSELIKTYILLNFLLSTPTGLYIKWTKTSEWLFGKTRETTRAAKKAKDKFTETVKGR